MSCRRSKRIVHQVFVNVGPLFWGVLCLCMRAMSIFYLFLFVLDVLVCGNEDAHGPFVLLQYKVRISSQLTLSTQDSIHFRGVLLMVL